MSDNLIQVISSDNLLTVEEITNLFTVDEFGNPQVIIANEPPVLLTVREETVNLLSVAAQGPGGTPGPVGPPGPTGPTGGGPDGYIDGGNFAIFIIFGLLPCWCGIF